MDNIELRWVWRSGAKTLQYRTSKMGVGGIYHSEWTEVPLVEGE